MHVHMVGIIRKRIIRMEKLSENAASSNDTSDDSGQSPSPPSSGGQSPPSDSSGNSPSSPPSDSPPKNDSSPPPSSPPPSDQSPPPSSPPPKNDSPPSSPPPSDNSPPPSSPPPQSPPPSSTPSPPQQSQSPPPSASTPPSSPPPAPKNNPPGTPPSPVVFSPPPPVSSAQTPPSHDHTKLSPPSAEKPPGSSGSDNNNHNSNSSPSPSSSTVGLVAGLAVGGLFVLVLVAVCIFCTRRKKKQRYYMGPGTGRPPKGGDQYYNNNNQWNRAKSMDHVMKVQQGEVGNPQGGWGAAAPANSSSEFGSGFSSQVPLGPQSSSPNMGGLGGFSQSQFTYEELAKATEGFSQTNLLGQGGFGYVHKGTLADGRVVAIKSLKSGSGQGEREFQAEVEIISRVHHRHLVSLVGYCIANGQRMLVYEYVANKTLEFHLHGKGQPVMDWETRLKIALGSAKGLAYLHEDCQHRIIHRDIKAANILLDDNYEALVADFGLAKLTSDNNTHVSTRVMGTFGYLAPEYASSGKLTEKSDVFSYGVMLLELITGRRPVDPNDRYMEDSLVDWARPLLARGLEEGKFDGLIDVRLEGNYDPDELHRMVACGAASIRHSAKRRPKMSQIVRALEGNSSLEDLNDSAKPGKTPSFASNGGGNTQAYDTAMYNADMSKFRKMVMTTSQDFSNSSEHGAPSE